jgi:hypothetical protein
MLGFVVNSLRSSLKDATSLTMNAFTRLFALKMSLKPTSTR